MKSSSLLWQSSTRCRHFLIPIAQELSEGSFLICSLSGVQRNVGLDSIIPFEINREEAKTYIQAELSNAFNQIQDTLGTLEVFSTIAQDNLIPNDKSPQRPKNPFATVLGVSQEELNENPGAIKDHWQSLVEGFQDLLKGATSDDPNDLDKAKAQMQRLKNHLQSQGVKVDDSIQNLPDTLREKYHSSDADPTLKASAEKLQEATQNIGRSFQDLLHTLKDGASKIRDAVEEAEANSPQSKSTESHNHSDGDSVGNTGSEEMY